MSSLDSWALLKIEIIYVSYVVEPEKDKNISLHLVHTCKHSEGQILQVNTSFYQPDAFSRIVFTTQSGVLSRVAAANLHPRLLEQPLHGTPSW